MTIERASELVHALIYIDINKSYDLFEFFLEHFEIYDECGIASFGNMCGYTAMRVENRL